MANLDRTRAVVEAGETFDGKIVPTEQAEIHRPVRVRERATVAGSVYGERVEIDADAVVDGSAMAASDVSFEGGTVRGEVGTPGSVTGTGATVHGTVTATKVRLVDSVVFGNVVGTDVILENCVVVGLAVAERRLTLERTLVYSFKSFGETTLEEATIVLPQAIADGDVSFETPVTVTGLGELETEGVDVPTMDADDRIQQGETTYLTLSPRILNLEKVTDRLETLEERLTDVVTATASEDAPPVEELLAHLGVDEKHHPAVLE